MIKKDEQFKLDLPTRRRIRVAAEDTITQSEIMTRAACPRKWFYRYALRLDRLAAFNPHLIYGSLMHSALAELYSQEHYGLSPKEKYIEIPELVLDEDMLLTPDNRYDLDIIKAKVQIAFDAYRWHYFEEDKPLVVKGIEHDYLVAWKDLRLTGRIDMLACPKKGDGVYIWDWKTAGRFDASMLDAWSFRFQFLFYCWLYWRATGIRPSGIMVNGLQKSQLKPKIVNPKTKEKETAKEYLARVKVNFRENRDKFFYRQRMPLAKGILLRFEEEMLAPHLDAYILMSKTNTDINTNVLGALTMAMNTGHCHVYNSFCEYLPLCQHGPIFLNEYKRREVKHKELTTTEPELGEEG